MIGLIVTGHGNFATGLTSSLSLIAGEQKDYVAVDYDGNGTDKIEADIKAAMDSLQNCSGIIVFSDLAGGCPFKTSVVISQGYKNVRVLAGTNLPMLCEIALSRTMIDDIDMLVSSALRVGKDGVQEFSVSSNVVNSNDDSDGI